MKHNTMQCTVNYYTVVVGYYVSQQNITHKDITHIQSYTINFTDTKAHTNSNYTNYSKHFVIIRPS